MTGLLAQVEPFGTAVLLVAFGVLMAVSAIFSRAMDRLGVPILLLFLVLGMLAGSEGIGRLQFTNYALAFRIGTIALVLILFDGGLSTASDDVRRSIKPAAVLATVGVIGTAALVALFGWLVGLDWKIAMLLGSVVSSTDAAAVFAVLRGSSLRLQKRIGTTLELESCLNDPMAVILTVTVGEMIVSRQPLGWDLLYAIPLQLLIGTVAGLIFGRLGTMLLRRVRVQTGGLYPALTLAVAFAGFGATTLVGGSGFLTAYISGIVMGNSAIPYRHGLGRIHEAIAWLSQITMFLILGLLVTPSQLLPIAPVGLAVGLLLAVVGRPLIVWLCLLPFKYPAKEVAYIGWIGLRGAVPIILGTFPLMIGVPDAEKLFHLVFFIVVLSCLVPGATIRPVTKRLGLEAPDVPAPAGVLEINSMRVLHGDLRSFYIDDTLAVCGAAISQIRFPPNSAAILLVRGDELIAPRGDTVLQPGDHLYIFYRPEDKAFIELMFGRPQEGGAPGEP